MRTTQIQACVVAALLAVSGTAVSVSAQTPPGAAPVPGTEAPVRRLTVDEAVRLAAENNLGIQIARYTPQLEDLNIATARAAWAPAFTTTFSQNRITQPATGFLDGSNTATTNGRFSNNVGITQLLPTGGSYSIGWDSARQTTNNLLTNYPTQLTSSLALSFSQPLLRGFHIDNTRQQVALGAKNREIADVQLRQSLATTTRTVRNAYWDLAYARAALAVQQQSLDLAQESLRNTRSRVEIGTTPPIDIVEAEAEVANREEAVIIAEAQIQTAEDALRALVYDPDMPDFWTIHIETVDEPAFRAAAIDVDGAVRTALDRRTDLDQTRKSLEANDISIRFLRNQTLPEVTANVDYGLSGIGGTQLVRAPGGAGGGLLGDVTGQTQRGYASVLRDLVGNDFPRWTVSLNINYPIGQSPQEANLARARLQQGQAQTQLKNQQLQITTQVREAGRQAQTNQKRVDTTRVARELAERRMDAEQRKFAAGTSTSFLVFQAQRDLAQARNNELLAILDYQRSLVDFETVQDVPLAGGGSAVAGAR